MLKWLRDSGSRIRDSGLRIEVRSASPLRCRGATGGFQTAEDAEGEEVDGGRDGPQRGAKNRGVEACLIRQGPVQAFLRLFVAEIGFWLLGAGGQ